MGKFELEYPVKPMAVNQPFGVDKVTYGQFGLNGHNGIDFRAQHGQPIYAAHDGLAYYQVDSSQGHGVVVVSDQPYDYKKSLAFFKSIYWHMCDPAKEPKFTSPIFAAVGKNTSKSVPVKTGDLLGYADNTGFSNGDHLHFGLKPITAGKPPVAGDSNDVNIGKWINIEQNNGFLGSIDPTPYFTGSHAADVSKQKLLISALTSLVGLYKKVING